MLCIKLFSLFVIILCLTPERSQVSATFGCFLKYCNNNEQTVYASDGKNCLVYRNPCHVKNANCIRSHNNKPYLSIITKEACQAKCIKDCGTKKSPVCGEYAGLYKTFANDCELLKTACHKGQSIIKVKKGKCPVKG